MPHGSDMGSVASNDGVGMTSDDQDWLDLLAGRAAPDADPRTCKEAAWLRAALLSYRANAPSGAPAPADERVVRLLARARNAGILVSTESSTLIDTPRKPSSAWRYAVAAGVAMFAAMLALLPSRLQAGHPGDQKPGAVGSKSSADADVVKKLE